MKQNSLYKTGLSLSHAQSLSNLCHQSAREIGNTLDSITNCEKQITTPDGKTRIMSKGIKIPDDIIDLLRQKAELYAAQGFLMENIKAKDEMLKFAKNETPDISSVIMPERPVRINAKILPNIDENFGWEQLSASENNEYIEADAYAAHIGQFIHKRSILEKLRMELLTIPTIEWTNIKDGEKTPVDIIVHKEHTPEKLFAIHEQLAGIHRQHEQRVNYYKAKVKNLTTLENARIAKVNADAQNEAESLNKEILAKYEGEYRAANERIKCIQTDFEKERHAKINEISKLRIKVDPRFQPVIDRFSINFLLSEAESQQ